MQIRYSIVFQNTIINNPIVKFFTKVVEFSNNKIKTRNICGFFGWRCKSQDIRG